MVDHMKIYLAGSIPKGDRARGGWVDWKTRYRDVLTSIPHVEILNGDDLKDETNSFKVFGHDAHMVKSADIIIVNAEKEIGKGLGAGTAQEMVIAKYFARPVLTVLPKDSHHRRSDLVFHGVLIHDWIHPFLDTFSDLIVDKVADCLGWITKYSNNPSRAKIKDITIIDIGIEYFLEQD